MDLARRNGFAPVILACLLLTLVTATGCCRRCTGAGGDAVGTESPAGDERGGVSVTKEVPHSKETIPDVMNRERTNPLPAREDTAIHSHKIPLPGNDNGMSIPPGDENTVK